MPPLAPDYYLKNIEKVLAVVLSGHRHLFTPPEIERFETFLAAPVPARRLYVRLFLRVGPVFRLEKLRYREIPDAEEAALELDARGLAVYPAAPEGDDDVPAFLRPFNLRELAALVPDLPGGLRKEAAIGWLCERPETYLEILDAGRFIVLADDELFALLPLLFFGNRHQDLATLVVADIEQVRFPSYTVSRDRRLFDDREGLDDYLDAVWRSDEGVDDLTDKQLLETGREAIELLSSWRPQDPYRTHLDAGRYRSRLAWQAARELQRRGLETEARTILAPLARCGPLSGRLEAFVRLTTPARSVRLTPGEGEAAAALLADPLLGDGERFLIEKRLAMLGLRPDPAEGLRPARIIELELEPAGRQGSKALYRLPAGEAATIEEAVLASLGRKEPDLTGGLLAENRLYRTLFGLLFWDVLFSPVPGMFQHRYQTAPMDLGSRRFREARRGPIESRLREITVPAVPHLLTRSYLAHEGETCRLVAFDAYSLGDLLAAAKVLGPALPPIMERLACDPVRNGRGLPDLLLFFASQGGALACEVKGPGDQPSCEQLLWHDRLLRFGVDVAIARVRTAC